MKLTTRVGWIIFLVGIAANTVASFVWSLPMPVSSTPLLAETLSLGVMTLGLGIQIGVRYSK